MFGKLCRALKQQRGFSLVELMIVVIILGILVAIAIPVYRVSQKEAETKACKSNQRLIESAAEQYYLKEGSYPSDVDALVNGGYLKNKPKCPDETVSATNREYSLGNNGKLNVTNGKLQCGHDYYAK